MLTENVRIFACRNLRFLSIYYLNISWFYYSEGIEEDTCFSKLIVSDTCSSLTYLMSSCSLLTNIFKLCFTL